MCTQDQGVYLRLDAVFSTVHQNLRSCKQVFLQTFNGLWGFTTLKTLKKNNGSFDVCSPDSDLIFTAKQLYEASTVHGAGAS